MFKSPFAAGVVWGLGVSCLYIIPITFATLTDTGLYGFGGCVALMLLVAAAIAEIRARKKGGNS